MGECDLCDVLSGLLFAMLVAYINARVSIETGIHQTCWFWDDCTMYGPPDAVKRAMQIIVDLQELSGLEVKSCKCVVHAPTKDLAEWITSREVFQKMRVAGAIAVRGEMDSVEYSSDVSALQIPI